VGSVSPPLPFEKHAACGVSRRVPSMTRLMMTAGPNKKIRRKFQTPPGIIKAETQQAPELSNPNPLLSVLL
jgi:hypothetical protein